MPKLAKTRIKVPSQRPNYRIRAFARLEDIYASRTRAEGAETDLAAALIGCPNITEGLELAPGGIKAVLNALRLSENPDARQFIAMWDSLSKEDQVALTLEEVAVASDVGVSRLLGAAELSLRSYGQSMSQSILWAGMPKMVSKSMQDGMKFSGRDQRDAMFKAAAFLPVPKGSNVAVQINQQLPSAKDEANEPHPWNQATQLKAIQGAWGNRELPAAPTVQPLHGPLDSALDAIQERTTDVLDAD